MGYSMAHPTAAQHWMYLHVQGITPISMLRGDCWNLTPNAISRTVQRWQNSFPTFRMQLLIPLLLPMRSSSPSIILATNFLNFQCRKAKIWTASLRNRSGMGLSNDTPGSLSAFDHKSIVN